MTVEEVGERLMCSATKISRLETGARSANPRDVRDLCQLYGVAGPAQADELMELARRAREPAWWSRYDDDTFSPLLGLEQEASAITSYCMYYVPALLQTSDYARAIIKGIVPKIRRNALNQRVEARMRRQQLLDSQPPFRFRALIDQAVLLRQVGGPAVMKAQLEKMLGDIGDGKATVQVIPFEVGAYASADSNFDFLEIGDESHQRPVVFVEGLYSNRYYERPDEIARYREALENLRDAALSPRDSASLITEVRGEIKV
jgi:transcriptional regulator with XRE-family HTH domain